MAMDTRLSFRPATPADADGVMDVLRAFPRLKPGGSEWQRQREAVRANAAQWRVGVAGGRVVSAIHAEPGAVWFGKRKVSWVDVGNVSVLPELQARGYGTQAMTDAVAWLRKAGYAVSRLGGLTRFYSRFGYRSFPRQYVEFPVQRRVRAGTSELPFADAVRPAVGSSGLVRPFDRERDASDAWRVAQAFNRHRTGCRVWERPPDQSPPSRPTVVFAEAGRVRGFATYRVYPEDISAFEGGVTVYQLAYEPGCVPALDALVRHMLEVARSGQARRMTALLPFDAAMRRDLACLAVEHSFCQAIERVAGNMIQVLSLRSLLSQISGELSERLQPLKWSGRISIDIGKQRATLSCTAGKVTVDDDAPAETALCLDEVEMLRMVLGVMPPVWPDRIGPAHSAHAALCAMFPPVSGGFNT